MLELKADDLRLSHEYGRGLILSLHLDYENAPETSSFVSSIKGGYANVKLSKWTDARSLTANGYAWSLIDKIAVQTRTAKEDVYRHLLREMGGITDTICMVDGAVDRFVSGWISKGLGWMADVNDSRIQGCKNVTVTYGSSVFDKSEMNRFIDLIIEDCRQLHIETLKPKDLERMIQEWA